MLNQNFKNSTIKYRRYFFEFLGSERYSRPYRRGVGSIIEKYLPQNGFFIEVGANNGFSESNTYYLERFRNCKGILIEPIPHLYQECVKERPNSQVFNCALVSSDYPEPEIEMMYGHLMSLVKGAFDDDQVEAERVAIAGRKLGFTPYKIKVPARTLTSILDEANVSKIDFLSLDVEGFELNALQGLDFDKYRPEYMLIECLNEKYFQEIESYIGDRYNLFERASEVDYLFKSKE
ncbi:FkbM family methyltransferase [Rivularia sp. UHCC 0363]|uniref:FkbM family methyltransferase n=1 Tax=Rivularia sp. UHCC 0363 TaxID=3110244 RepID=UPI002B201888|nr:FkbM family methyltransferase [Rivularia sp. UHCC 0363]MEA5593750.1 FkbM family methyltransferase [Rivularia sp. UHCC 0363]